MRFLTILLVSVVLCCVNCKNNVKSLTESLGQEDIEIGTPVKELPPELEEEPSAEVDDDEKEETRQEPKKLVVTTATVPPVTKKDVKKTITVDTRRKNKEAEDEDDARIEKELAEIYRDNTDYKDSSDAPAAKANNTNKSALRVGSSFKFQPDLNNKKEVDRFRTSIDDISCAKSVTRLDDRDHSNANKKTSGDASRSAVSGFLSAAVLFSIVGSNF